MRALGSTLLAVLGGIVGYFFTAIVYYLAATAIEGGDFEGGIAIGSALVVGPIGAVLGAGIGLFAGLKRFKRHPPGNASQGQNSINPQPPDFESGIQNSTEQPGGEGRSARSNGFLDGQAIAAIAGVGLIMLAVWFFLLREETVPKFPQFGPRPTAYFEVKVPKASIREADDFQVRAELASVNNVLRIYERMQRWEEGDAIILSGRIKLINKTADRNLRVWLSRDAVHVFELGLQKQPVEQAEFSPWRRVSRIEYRRQGVTDILPADADFYIRTRARWGDDPN